MTSIYPVIRKLKIMCCIVYETQSMIHCADIPHGFAKGGLHPTLQERGLSIECLIHDRLDIGRKKTQVIFGLILDRIP